MTPFQSSSVQEIPTSAPEVYAFTIDGHVDDDQSEALAKYMNDAFDRHDTVDMLMDLTRYSGSDSDAMLNAEVIRSRLRSLGHVRRYAVVGAPDTAEKMIALMDKIIPVNAKTFDTSEIDDAWAFVGARPVT